MLSDIWKQKQVKEEEENGMIVRYGDEKRLTSRRKMSDNYEIIKSIKCNYVL